MAEEILREGLDAEATERVNLRCNGNKTTEEFPIHLDAKIREKVKDKKSENTGSILGHHPE